MDQLEFTVSRVFRIIERPICADWKMDHIFYEKEFVMTLVTEGETEYQINNQRYHVQKNDIVIFPPGVLRSGKTNPANPWSFIYIVFHMDTNKHARNFFDKSILVFRDASDGTRLRFCEAAKAWLGKNPLYQVRCNLLTTEILYKLVLSSLPYQKVPHIKKLEKTRAFIQDNYTGDISVKSLADSVDMSVSYYRRLFREAYGCSPMQYIVDLRIENARNLLLSGEVNVSEAAQLSGFDDIYYFSALFKRKTGYSPIQILRKG